MNLKSKIASLEESKQVIFIERIKNDGAKYGIYPLTINQNSIWCQYKASSQKSHFSNPCFSLSVRNTSAEKMKAAVETLFSLHDVFKFKFIAFAEEVYQYIDVDAELPLDITDISERDIKKEEEKFYSIPFDLENDIPLRTRILRISESEYILLFCIHHIVCDGRSSGIILSDLYTLLNGGNVTAKNRFGLIAAEKKTSESIARQIENNKFWIDKISEVPKFLGLPTDFPRNRVSKSCAGIFKKEISADVCSMLREKALKTKSNMYVVLSSIFSLIIMKWANKEQVILGSTFFNRNSDKDSEVVGDFATSAPLVFSMDRELTLHEYIRKNMNAFSEALDHSDLVFSNVAEAFPFDRTEDTFPLYQSYLVYHTQNLLGGDLGADITMRDLADSEEMDDFMFDVAVKVIDTGDRLILTAQYAKSLFREETISGIMDIFASLLESTDLLFETKLKDISFCNKCDFSKTVNGAALPKIYELAEISPKYTYTYNEEVFCILDKNQNALPESFFGELYRKSQGKWYSTGKIARVNAENYLEIDQTSSYMIERNGKIFDLKKISQEIQKKFPSTKSEFKLLDGEESILVISGCVPFGNNDELIRSVGYAPDLIYRLCSLKGKKLLDHQRTIFKAKKAVEALGYQAVVSQQDGSDDFDIILIGEKAAPSAEISSIENKIRSERISYYYCSDLAHISNKTDLFAYPKRTKSETELEITNLWQEVIGASNFTVYDNFYEVGGNSVKVIALLHRLNETFPVALNIADLFVYNTILAMSEHIDKLLSRDDNETQETDILSF